MSGQSAKRHRGLTAQLSGAFSGFSGSRLEPAQGSVRKLGRRTSSPLDGETIDGHQGYVNVGNCVLPC